LLLISVEQTLQFQSWITALRDRRAVARIAERIDRLRLGNFGDIAPVGAGVSELKISYGPGYRVYFRQKGARIVILLCGGDKSTQAADIRQAKALAAQL